MTKSERMTKSEARRAAVLVLRTVLGFRPSSFVICHSSTSLPRPMQMAKQFQFKKTSSVKMDYLLFLPNRYEAESEQRRPLILFLHGAGERGTDVWKVATHGPPKDVTENPDFPFIVLSPLCPEGPGWSKD